MGGRFHSSYVSTSSRDVQVLFVAWYNLCRKHEALKGNTPTTSSGLSDHVWTIKEMIERVAAA